MEPAREPEPEGHTGSRVAGPEEFELEDEEEEAVEESEEGDHEEQKKASLEDFHVDKEIVEGIAEHEASKCSSSPSASSSGRADGVEAEEAQGAPADRPSTPGHSDPSASHGELGQEADEVERLAAQAASAGRLPRWWPALRRRWTKSKEKFVAAARGSRRSRDGEGGDGLLFDDAPACSSEQGEEASGSDQALIDAWLVVDQEGCVLAEDRGEDTDFLTNRSVETKIEHTLTWMLAPAIHGIPKLGVLGAADRADELLAAHGRDVESAVREVVAGSERTVSALVLNFCLQRIPVLGCPTVLLRTTWGNLRSILIIAALYGHDLESLRVQHEALLCLVPPGDEAAAAALQRQSPGSSQGLVAPTIVTDAAQKVARMTIKGALRRATGLQAAVDCFELASLLYSSCGAKQLDEDGFVHVLATPASAARDFFRRKSLASCALLWCSLPLLALGMAAPSLLTVLRYAGAVEMAFRGLGRRIASSGIESAPALLLLLVGLGCALHTFGRLWGHGFRWRWRSLWRYVRGAQAVETLQEAWPSTLTMLVFTLHALLPAVSIFSAVSVVLDSLWPSTDGLAATTWDPLHRLSCLALGLFGLTSVALHKLQSEHPEAERASDAGSTLLRGALRTLHFAMAAARGLCVLAAWTYASLVLDLVTTRGGELAGLKEVGSEGTLLRVVGPLAWLFGADAAVNPLRSERAVKFGLNLIGVTCQQRLFELLSRREVLLRLIGAERVMAHTLCLLLKGVAVACNNAKNGSNPIADFLTSVSPSPACCVVVVALRSQALVLGASLKLAPLLLESGLLGTGGSFSVGILAGGYAAYTVMGVWYANGPDLDSPALRLALLVPGSVSGRACGLLRGALTGARTRAVQMMAMGIIERAARWCWGPR